MKRLKLTAALLLLGMLTGSPKVSAQQIEPINLGCTKDLRIIFGQKAPDFCRSAEADSGLLFDGLEVKEGADRSIQIDMKVFNRGSADALVEVYDARGNLLDLKVIDGNTPPADLLRSGWDVFTKVPTSFFSRYPIGDPRGNLEEQTVSVTIPAGGYVDITKSSDRAYLYNVIIAAVDLIQLAQELAQQPVQQPAPQPVQQPAPQPAPQPAQGDPNFVQSEAMLKEMVLDFVKAYRDQAIVNIFKSEPVAEGIFSLDFLDRDKLIAVLVEFWEWVRDQESSDDPSKSPFSGAILDAFLDTANVGIETFLNRLLPRLGTFARAVRQGGSALNTAARVIDLYNNYFVAEEKAVVTLRNTAAPSSNFNDAVASVNQQLWGTWEGELDGDRMRLIFTPEGKLFMLPPGESNRGNRAIEVQYRINPNSQPMHLELGDFSTGNTIRMIFAFTPDGQLQMEEKKINSESIPTNFSVNMALLEKISNTTALPLNTELVDGNQLRRQVQQMEAISIIGAMNRAQQSYRLETNRFARTLQEMPIGGVESDTEYYRYLVNPVGNSTQSVIMSAQSKISGLKSYTGAVFAIQVNGETRTIAGICETNEPSMSPPGMPTFSRGEIQCPAGSRRL